MVNPCECIGPGYCSRHKIIKTEKLYQKCKEEEKYRKLWDEQAGSCGAKQFPSLIERMRTFSVALAKHIENGFKRVTKLVYNKRMEICDGCPSNIKGKCIECGCFLHIKADWATEDCPLGKWPKIELPMIDNNKKGAGCGGCGKRS